jgi:hypothetical protein
MPRRAAGLATVIAGLGLAGCLPPSASWSYDGGTTDAYPGEVRYCAASESAVSRLAIMILADRSAGMATDPSDAPCSALGCSKWDRVVAALERIVLQTDAIVDWGLELFPSGTDACGVDPGPAVPIASHNAAAIIDALVAVRPGGDAPLEVAEAAAVATFSDPSDKRLHLVLLATDGRPSCAPAAADPTARDDDGAAGAVRAAQNLGGVPTIVLGDPPASDPSAAIALSILANAGGVQSTGATAYYPADDPGQLVSAITTTVSDRSCTIGIPTIPQARTANDAIDLFLDGALVPRDTGHAEGWDYLDTQETTIQLYGPVCLNWLENVMSTLVIAFRCVGS